MDTLYNEGHKKLFIASWVMFIISIVVLIPPIVVMVLNDMGKLEESFDNIWWIMPTGFSVFACLLCISAWLHYAYRKNTLKAGVSSTVLLVLHFIVLLPFIIFGLILFVVGFFTGAFNGESIERKKLKKIKIRDSGGKEYILTQLAGDNYKFEDQDGEIWATYDCGATFECISAIKIKDENGDNYDLKPKSEFSSGDYTDQNGDTWQRFNTFGDTYARKAVIKDEDGKDLTLTKDAEFSDTYTDQNGGKWRSLDGKTFERW